MEHFQSKKGSQSKRRAIQGHVVCFVKRPLAIYRLSDRGQLASSALWNMVVRPFPRLIT